MWTSCVCGRGTMWCLTQVYIVWYLNQVKHRYLLKSLWLKHSKIFSFSSSSSSFSFPLSSSISFPCFLSPQLPPFFPFTSLFFLLPSLPFFPFLLPPFSPTGAVGLVQGLTHAQQVPCLQAVLESLLLIPFLISNFWWECYSIVSSTF